MVKRTREEAEHTRDAILDAAERLFYERGVARTTLEQIARAAGVTRGAVYWHFRNKLDLFEAMQERVHVPQGDIMERLAAGESDAPLEALCTLCCSVLKLIATDPQRRRVFAIVTYRCEYVAEMAGLRESRRQHKTQALDHFTRIFEHARRRGLLAAAWSPASAALGLFGMMVGLITDWVDRPEDYDLARRGPGCIERFFRSLEVDAGGGAEAEAKPPRQR